MADNSTNEDLHPADHVDAERRSFLRKSVYAAYATPLITTLLVEEAAASQSCTSKMLANCIASGWQYGYCKKCKPL